MSTCQLPAETSVSMLHDWVDPLLHKTILWLTDEKDNAAAAATDAENSDFRCLSIARDIITRRRFHLRVFFFGKFTNPTIHRRRDHVVLYKIRFHAKLEGLLTEKPPTPAFKTPLTHLSSLAMQLSSH